MRRAALVLTYHAIARGPAPLFVDPALLAAHLDCIVESGATVVTVTELAAALRGGTLPDRALALTFDDGFANVAVAAAPLLAERGLRATVFCVAEHIGGVSNWTSQPRSAPQLPLADAAALSALAAAGWEIGSHGLTHERLSRLTPDRRQHELEASRLKLEELIGVSIRSFAYPYGSVPAGAEAELRAAGYDSACTTRIATVARSASPFAIPRVDAHYVRRELVLKAILDGRAPGYLAARRFAARVRRVAVSDFGEAAAG